MENFSNKHCIYVHTNITNGKVYVGQTIGSTYEECNASRWDSGNGYKGQQFFDAIKKYGWNGFKHEIIKTGLSQEEANQLESYYIGKYDAYENGYNCTFGGSGIRKNNRTLLDYIIQSRDNKDQFIKANDLGRNGNNIHLVTTHSTHDNCDYTIVDFGGWPITIYWCDDDKKVEVVIYINEITKAMKDVSTYVQKALVSLGYIFDIEKFYKYNERSLGTPECYSNYIIGNHK